MSQFFQVFVVTSLLLLAGCQGKGCSPSQRTSVAGVECKLERVLGQMPRWGGACEDARSCWRTGRSRARWTRCLAGRCLFGASDPRLGHLKGVWALQMEPKGRLWSGDASGEVRRWQIDTGKTMDRWLAHKGPVRAIVETALGQIITAGDDEVVRMWQVKPRRQLRDWKVRGRISSLALSPDGQWLAAASTDRRVWLRRLQATPAKAGSKKDISAPYAGWSRWKGHTDAVRSVAFSSDGKRLVSASDDRTVRIWDVATGKILRVLRGHQGWVRKAIFGPKDRWLASGSFDLTIHIWGPEGKLQQRWGRPIDPFGFAKKAGARLPLPTPIQQTQKREQHSSDISDVVVSPDGKWLLATGHRSAIIRLPDDGTTARLWRRKDGRVACHLKGHQLGLTHGAFAPDKRRFATASEDGTIRIYTY